MGLRAVLRTDPHSALLARRRRRACKSAAAAELLARLLDKQNAAAWHFCKHTEPGVRASGAAASLAGMLCVTVEGFEDPQTRARTTLTDKVDELFQALIGALKTTGARRGRCLYYAERYELPRGARRH